MRKDSVEYIGNKFGKLTPIEKINETSRNGSKSIKYLCICECGNKRLVERSSLLKQKDISCLSCKILNSKSQSLIGNKYGMLTVIKLDHNHKKNGTYWECLCDCGNITIVSRHNLKSGAVLSCGCLVLKSAINRVKDISGMRFFNLMVIEYIGNSRWRCSCDCGNKDSVFASFYELKNGKVKSCGCYKARAKSNTDGGFSRMYYSYKKNASKKMVTFELTKEQFRKITGESCHYCGCVPNNIYKTVSGIGNYVYNGIDRVDNSIGYTLENCVPCCSFCNIAKNNNTEEYFILKIRQIYENLILSER